MCRARVYGSNKWIQQVLYVYKFKVYKSLSRRMRMPRGKYTGSRCRVFATGSFLTDRRSFNRHEGVDVWVSVVHRPDCSLRSTSSQVLLSTLPQDLKLFIRMKSGMIVHSSSVVSLRAFFFIYTKPVLHEHQQQQQQQQHLPNERGNFSPPPLPGSSGAVIVHDASEQGQEEKKASSKRRSKRGMDHDLQQYVKEDDTISPRVVAIDGRKVQRYAGEKVSLGPLAFAVLEASFPAAVRGVRFEPEFLEQCDMMCLCGYKAAAAEGESDDTQFSGVNKHGRGTEEEDVVVSSRCEHEEGGNKHAVQLHCYQKQHGSGRNRQQTKWQRVTPRINFIDDGEIWLPHASVFDGGQTLVITKEVKLPNAQDKRGRTSDPETQGEGGVLVWYVAQVLLLSASPFLSPAGLPLVTNCALAIQAAIKAVLSKKACEKIHKRRTRRMNAETEMLENERKYVGYLNILRDVYQYPIEVLAKKRKWKSENYTFATLLEDVKNDISGIFSYLKPILDLHQETILPELEKSYAEGKGVAAPFNKYAKFFGIYAQYLQNYNHACDILHRYRTKHKRFRTLLDTQRNDPNTGRRKFQDIVSYMIMPCQRISRYQLLLMEIMKNSFEEENPIRYKEIESAHNVVQSVAMSNELYQKNSEDITRLLQLQNKIKALSITVFAPTRRLVKEGEAEVGIADLLNPTESHQYFSEKMETTKKITPSKLYVFSDLILWTNLKDEYSGSASLLGSRLEACGEKKAIGESFYMILKDAALVGKKNKRRKDTMLHVSFGGKVGSSQKGRTTVDKWVGAIRDAISSCNKAEASRKLRTMR
eukprot:jgi/Bigna1/76059/fgenesh1_pg.38_\